jgi:hypothetical protein
MMSAATAWSQGRRMVVGHFRLLDSAMAERFGRRKEAGR